MIQNYRNFNDIKLYFGVVQDIKDPLHLNRIKCTISDYTDQIAKDDLPFYYPFFGQDYLPDVGDVVPVFICNEDFSQGFYNHKIDLTKRTDKEINDGEEYEKYVELYDKMGITATYKKEKGWEFKNKETILQLEKEKATLKSPNEHITITDKRIEIGAKNQIATPLGDKTIESLLKNQQHIISTYAQIMAIFEAIKQASSNPWCSPIRAALEGVLPPSKTMFKPLEKANEVYFKNIQSKKVFIE